jgi:tRNA-modifying protein YgfZ
MTAVESQATQRHVSVFDRSDRLRMQFSGAKAAESLTGLVTNDVLALRGGDGVYACALTAKGRVIADVRILAVADEDRSVGWFMVDANAAAGAGFSAMIRKYVNPRLAKYVDVTVASACLTLDGGDAAELLRRVGADPSATSAVMQGPDFTHRQIQIAGIGSRLVRVPDLGSTNTFDLHVDRESLPALISSLTSAGAVQSDEAEWHRRRIVAGRPEWGADMDEGTLAQEANMDALRAISYQKGCYTGQETVARVHFRGHVNRTLRRVQYLDIAMPPAGAPLYAADSSAAGDARSSARTDGGQLVGIAMLRRTVASDAPLSWIAADESRHQAIAVGDADAD